MLQVQDVEISKLKPWENNPRLNDAAVDAVARSIRSFGFNVPILCDQDFTIVAGHTRWKAAKKIGLTTVPTIVLRLTDSQRRAFAVTVPTNLSKSREDVLNGMARNGRISHHPPLA